MAIMVTPQRLLALYLLFSIVTCSTMLDAAADGKAEVEKLLEHWKAIAHGMPKGAVVRQAYTMSNQELGDLGKDQCQTQQLIIFRYHVANNSFTCFNHNPEYAPMYCRGYLGFLHHVVAQPAYRSLLTHDFAWYFETADGFQVSKNSHKLPLPLLANARNPQNWHGDIFSIPAPDNFMTWAYYRYLLGDHRDDVPEDTFHVNSWRIFAYIFTQVPWEDAIDNIIFRARYWGTQDPNRLNEFSVPT
eukprot:gene31665-6863_t